MQEKTAGKQGLRTGGPEQKLKKVPVLFRQKSECCGCTACSAICPAKAIYMEKDEEGFEYPHIEEEKCIRCEQCIRVCPLK